MLVGVNTIPSPFRICPGNEDRYLFNVLSTAGGLKTDTKFVVFTHEGNHSLYEGCERLALSAGGGFQGLLGGGSIVGAVKKAGVDVLLSPIDAAPSRCPVPQVLYALDLLPWETGQDGQGRKKAAQVKVIKAAAAKARAVLAPSEYLRRRCLELFEIPLNKTILTPLGINSVLRTPRPAFIDKPYVMLFCDAVTEHSQDRMFQVFKQLWKEYHFTFAVAGTGNASEPENWGSLVVRVDRCPDSQLASLYQNSELFLYPSLYDGSGMRLLEALYTGTLIVTTNSGANAEIADKAPVYYNAANMGSMLQAVRRIIEEPESQREERRRLGKRVTSELTWEKCAWKFLSAFKRK